MANEKKRVVWKKRALKRIVSFKELQEGIYAEFDDKKEVKIQEYTHKTTPSGEKEYIKDWYVVDNVIIDNFIFALTKYSNDTIVASFIGKRPQVVIAKIANTNPNSPGGSSDSSSKLASAMDSAHNPALDDNDYVKLEPMIKSRNRHITIGHSKSNGSIVKRTNSLSQKKNPPSEAQV